MIYPLILCCAALAAHSTLQIIKNASLHAQLLKKQEEASFLAEERLQERRGRIKAEKELRNTYVNIHTQEPSTKETFSTTSSPINRTSHTNKDDHIDTEDDTIDNRSLHNPFHHTSNISFPLKPIGTLHTCFTQRNGTPRQPLLTPRSRGILTLRSELPAEFFHGLNTFSHCWILYIFHENTDIHRLWKDTFSGIRAKIRVPRLNGERRGTFATRSPHRPSPIGLSVARILDIRGRSLILGEIDMVNGSPVLDIKPYVPFCDAVHTAQVPSWVAPVAKDHEALEISSVDFDRDADSQLEACWNTKHAMTSPSMVLYNTYEEYKAFVIEVLSRDIRSVAQRIKVPAREEQKGFEVPALIDSRKECAEDGQHTGDCTRNTIATAALCGDNDGAKWHVVLDGIDIAYHVDEYNAVSIRYASLSM